MANYMLWLPKLVRRIPDTSLNEVDLHGGQWPSEVKGSNYGYHMVERNCRCKFKMIMTCMEVKGQIGSNIVYYVPWLQTWSEYH